jgi:hypothetical protein
MDAEDRDLLESLADECERRTAAPMAALTAWHHAALLDAAGGGNQGGSDADVLSRLFPRLQREHAAEKARLIERLGAEAERQRVALKERLCTGRGHSHLSLIALLPETINVIDLGPVDDTENALDELELKLIDDDCTATDALDGWQLATLKAVAASQPASGIVHQCEQTDLEAGLEVAKLRPQ